MTTHARRDLQRLSDKDYDRIDKRISSLAQAPRARAVKLQDKAYRIRIGPWRVIYIVDDDRQVVVITHIRRREKDTYR